MDLWTYITTNYIQILTLAIEHIKLTGLSVGLAILIGVPFGILMSYTTAKVSRPILFIVQMIQSIPSVALLGLIIPFIGIGTLPAIIMIVLYALLPVIKNTYTGIHNINPETFEAAKGIGLTSLQILTKVQIPLALPVIVVGVRMASVTAISLITIAALSGASGLGNLILSGIRTVNHYQMLAGAIPVCVLALVVDLFMRLIEKLITPTNFQKVEQKI